jgi:RHS repeat-associated protein
MLTKKFLYHNTVRSAPFLTTLCTSKQATWRRKGRHGAFGGKSDIQYKPYGEIDRPHSSGPDISKYKYTGQEEDKESGLLYYKARYYDPGLARFIQSDEEVHPESVQGMNRSMYTNGSPTNFIDPNGRNASGNPIQNLIDFFTTILTPSDNPSLEESILKIYFFFAVARFISTGFTAQFSGLHVPGHKYTGDGAADPFQKFFSFNRNKKREMYFSLGVLMKFYNIPAEHAVVFIVLLPHLRPHPRSYMDSVSQRHDDESPTNTGDFSGGTKNSIAIIKADMNFIEGFYKGLFSGKLNVEDFIVGAGGSFLFTVSIFLRICALPTQALAEAWNRNKKIFK